MRQVLDARGLFSQTRSQSGWYLVDVADVADSTVIKKIRMYVSLHYSRCIAIQPKHRELDVYLNFARNKSQATFWAAYQAAIELTRASDMPLLL